MVTILEQLIFPSDGDTHGVYTYLQLLGVPVTKTGIASLLGGHPDSGTLLSVSDTLTSFGVENAVAGVSAEQLEQLETPFIARMKSGDGLSLAVVKRLGDDGVVYLPPAGRLTRGSQRWVTASKQVFLDKYDGIILIGEAGEGAGQPDYASAFASEKRRHSGTVAALAVLPVLVVSAVVTALSNHGWSAAIPSLYTLLSLAGTAVGALLLWYEVDRHNPTLRQVCSGGKNVDCDAILHSKASSIFGIGFSLIGFSYFTGSLLLLLMGGITDPALFSLLSLFSLIAVGYTVFSLYYQWRIARQWCKLCLWVQGILVAQAALVLIDGRLFSGAPTGVSIPSPLIVIVCFVLPFLAGLLIVPTFKKVKEGESRRRELARLKHNPQIFQALLEKQKAVTASTDGLGIVLGNPNASHRIVKVCNPYCGPCAKAHPAIEEILHHNQDVQVQIIFTASDAGQDFNAPPVRHLLAVAEIGDEILLAKALDDWYLPPKKDYAAFAEKYPMNGELQNQGGKLTAMNTWCNEMGIRFTPTFFVDGYQLPEMYTVEDLKYFLRT